MAINSLNFYLECRNFSLTLESFEEYKILGRHFFFFFALSTLNILNDCLMVSKVSDKKSADSLIEDPLYVIICFSLSAFKICSLSFQSLLLKIGHLKLIM